MGIDLLASLRRLSDQELVARMKDLAARERGAMVELVAHLAELDTRDVHLRAGHGSLFSYCREVLALSEQDAYNRIAVARAVRRFPVILERLEAGVLNLTAVRLLGPHLTPENHREVLLSARGKSKLQVEEIAARLWPRPDAPSVVRKLPVRRGPDPGSMAPVALPVAPSSLRPLSPGAAWAPLAASPDPTAQAPTPVLPGPASSDAAAPGPGCSGPPSPLPLPLSSRASLAPPAPSFLVSPAPLTSLRPPLGRPSAEVTPLSPDRYRVQVTIGGDTLEKLRLAKDLLRHTVPSGDEAIILDRALTALLSNLAQRKFAAAENPRAAGGTSAAPGLRTGSRPEPGPASRHIPADVKRTVWVRDLGRCAFYAKDGRRCAERAFLEFHHLHPYALGGGATVRNIQLRCRAHNDYEGRMAYGRKRGPLLVPERVGGNGQVGGNGKGGGTGPRGPSP